MSRDEMIMQRVKDHYKEALTLGREVVGVWLQGSQNYNLDIYSNDYISDVDTKCIVLPSLDDIVKGTLPYSHTHVRANNEHIDIKDIRDMIEQFKKQNTSYIEILFTKYFVINPKYQKLVDLLLSKRDEICRLNTNQWLRCTAGMSQEKLKALEHPYPSIIDKIEKFGYDPKQLHHILRLNDCMKKYIANKNYSECLVPDNIEYLKQIKVGILPLDEAKELAIKIDAENKKLKEDNLKSPEPVNQGIIDFLNEMKSKFIKQYLKEEILNDKEKTKE